MANVPNTDSSAAAVKLARTAVGTRVLDGFDDVSFGAERWERLLSDSDADMVYLTWHWQRSFSLIPRLDLPKPPHYRRRSRFLLTVLRSLYLTPRISLPQYLMIHRWHFRFPSTRSTTFSRLFRKSQIQQTPRTEWNRKSG